MQQLIRVATKGRGSIEITEAIAARLPARGAGVVHVFVRHTSCGLAITEIADADVRVDLETLLGRWAPDGDRAYRHTLEGADDMAAHGRALLTGVSLSVPYVDGRLLLGNWQGVFLFEHRKHGQNRELVLTCLGSAAA